MNTSFNHLHTFRNMQLSRFVNSSDHKKIDVLSISTERFKVRRKPHCDSTVVLACLFGSFLYIDGLLVLMCPVRPDLCCVLSDHYTRLFHYDRFWLKFTHTCRKILYSHSLIRSIVLTFVFKIHFNLKKALKCTILTIN